MANRQGDGEMQANCVHGARLPDVEPNKGGEEHQGSEWYANWHQIKEDLIDIREGLKEEEENNGEVFDSGGELIAKLSRVIAHVPRVSRAKNAAEDVEAWLDWIKALLRNLTNATPNLRALNTTWANIAAAGVWSTGGSPAISTARHTVRVQVPQAKGLPNEEILREVKKTIPRAAAIRVLQSGDIDVSLLTEAVRDRV